MLADQEIEQRLASTVSGLRRGIASARSLHASLRSEAKSLEDFIPMLVEGARSSITSLLKHQASGCFQKGEYTSVKSRFQVYLI